MPSTLQHLRLLRSREGPAPQAYDRALGERVRRTQMAPAVKTVNPVSHVKMRPSDEGCQCSGNAITEL
jgi:hypothetical protein